MDADDDQLLVRAKKDPEAFAMFYRRYFDSVLAYFMRRTASPELAADLTAETFASALGAVRRYKPRRGSAAAWLFTIAQNQLVDSHRRGRVQQNARQRLRMEPLIVDDGDIAEIERRLSEASEIDVLLSGLTEQEREAVLRRVVTEQSYPEIASTLQCSEAVVRKRLSRGIARLRSNLEGSA